MQKKKKKRKEKREENGETNMLGTSCWLFTEQNLSYDDQKWQKVFNCVSYQSHRPALPN